MYIEEINYSVVLQYIRDIQGKAELQTAAHLHLLFEHCNKTKHIAWYMQILIHACIVITLMFHQFN